MRPGTGMAMPPPQTGMRTAAGTAMGTSAGGANSFGGGIREGKFTEQIYSMIRDAKYHEAIAVLSTKVLEFPTSRAATSLLAYCYYHVGDFQNAIQYYERLTRLCPENDEYKFHYAQALFKAGLYDPAVKACQSVADVPDLVAKVQLLQVRRGPSTCTPRGAAACKWLGCSAWRRRGWKARRRRGRARGCAWASHGRRRVSRSRRRGAVPDPLCSACTPLTAARPTTRKQHTPP